MWRRTLATILASAGLSAGMTVASQDSLSKDLKVLTDLTTRPLAQRSARWQCVPTVFHSCTSEGCKSLTPVVSVRLDLAERTYTRCEKTDCVTYPLTFTAGGIFTTATPLGSPSTLP